MRPSPMENTIILKEHPVPQLDGIDVNRPIGLTLDTFASNEERIQLQVKDLTLDTATLKFLLTQQSPSDGGIQFVTQQDSSLQEPDVHSQGVNIHITNLGNDLQAAATQDSSAAGIQNNGQLYQTYQVLDKDILGETGSKVTVANSFADDEQKKKFVARKVKNIKANIEELYKKAGVTAIGLVAFDGGVQILGSEQMMSLEENHVLKSVFWNAFVNHESSIGSTATKIPAKKSSEKEKAPLLSWPCDECDSCFSTQHNLVNHKLLVHSGLSAHKCEFCGKEFVDIAILQKHLTIHTDKNSFQCKVCGNSFAGKNLLDSHMKVHNEDKRYSCKFCGKSFNSTSSLQYHVNKHTGDKKCVCMHCNKEFTKMSSLKVHMRIHSGEQPYRCQECGKGFVVSTHLTRHLRVHSGERPYLCEICGKRFNRSSHLRIHFRIHSGEKPYECEICGKRFNQTVTRKKHLKTHAK